MLTDPVCGKHMNHNSAHIIIGYEGTDYFLCCPKCQAEFERTPKDYARPELGIKTKKRKKRPHRQFQY